MVIFTVFPKYVYVHTVRSLSFRLLDGGLPAAALLLSLQLSSFLLSRSPHRSSASAASHSFFSTAARHPSYLAVPRRRVSRLDTDPPTHSFSLEFLHKSALKTLCCLSVRRPFSFNMSVSSARTYAFGDRGRLRNAAAEIFVNTYDPAISHARRGKRDSFDSQGST